MSFSHSLNKIVAFNFHLPALNHPLLQRDGVKQPRCNPPIMLNAGRNDHQNDLPAKPCVYSILLSSNIHLWKSHCHQSIVLLNRVTSMVLGMHRRGIPNHSYVSMTTVNTTHSALTEQRQSARHLAKGWEEAGGTEMN